MANGKLIEGLSVVTGRILLGGSTLGKIPVNARAQVEAVDYHGEKCILLQLVESGGYKLSLKGKKVCIYYLGSYNLTKKLFTQGIKKQRYQLVKCEGNNLLFAPGIVEVEKAERPNCPPTERFLTEEEKVSYVFGYLVRGQKISEIAREHKRKAKFVKKQIERVTRHKPGLVNHFTALAYSRTWSKGCVYSRDW